MNEEKATPPSWWRYAKKQTKNESAIKYFPSLGSDNSLEQLYRKRNPGWTRLEGQAGYTKKYEVADMPPPLRYHDTRHYEVFQTGAIMRDVEFEKTNRSSASFVWMLDRGQLRRLPPPDPGTQVTIFVTLGQDPVVTEFVGNVISTPPGDNEYEIAMILTRKGGGSGLVYEGHGKCFLCFLVLVLLSYTDTDFLSEGLFAFGVRGGQHAQILSCLHRVLYGGGGVKATNWGKPLLLAHNSRPSTGQLPYSGRLETFLLGQRCNDL